MDKITTSGIIVIAQNDQIFWDGKFGIEFDGKLSYEEDQKLLAYSTSMTKFVTEMDKIGNHILLVQTIPTFRNSVPIWDPKKCTKKEIKLAACEASIDTKRVDELQRPTRKIVLNLENLSSVQVIDLKSYFCFDGLCHTKIKGINAYKDATHISVRPSYKLSHFF